MPPRHQPQGSRAAQHRAHPTCKTKVAIVTGIAGSGMGCNIALILAREGASAVVNCRRSCQRIMLVLALLSTAARAVTAPDPADWMDPLTGASESGWILTSGSWMPFGGVKISPVNRPWVDFDQLADGGRRELVRGPAPRHRVSTATTRLAYAPAPPDNPLKGFVPYLRADPTFPHSLEWDYTKLAEVMTGPTNFHWAPFEAKLDAAASRGHQFIARFYLEWPGKTTGVPQYLIAAGLRIRTWTNTNTQPFPPAVDHTPDYEDPRLRAALTNFIQALGRRFDGDPRLGFVGLGLLGTWGEWHNSPHDEWFASKTVQREVMDAYETAFRKTRLLARYPAGTNDARYAGNHARAIGYHDDSFAWATVHTGKRGDEWFFEARLRAAGALGKWRGQPIGGEVRPEVWSCLFDEPSCAPKGQEFDRCLAVTHASWLCHEGVFRGKIKGAARTRAVEAARRLGYELHVVGVNIPAVSSNGMLSLVLTVTNTGVAPFYYDWPVELGVLDSRNQLTITWRPDWKLTDVLPGEPAIRWRRQADTQGLAPGAYTLLLRVSNPLPNGPPLRFANQTQDRHLRGWLTLGEFRR